MAKQDNNKQVMHKISFELPVAIDALLVNEANLAAVSKSDILRKILMARYKRKLVLDAEK